MPPNQKWKCITLLVIFTAAGFLGCVIYIQSHGNRDNVKKFSSTVDLSENPEIVEDVFSKPADIPHQEITAIKPRQNAIHLDPSSLSTDGLCPESPSSLVGPLAVTFEAPTYEEIAKSNPDLKAGGIFKPKECKARSKVAIIVPYRDREKQLRAFLHHMHPILQRQLLEYGIYIVEQSGNQKFNRALLMNIGYNESILDNNWECFIFHDVDLFLEDDRAPYGCSDGPQHMSGYIDKFDYKLPYTGIFGGISNIPRRQFEMVNGYSNLYFGWGGEDDDMYKRLSHKKFEVSRYNRNIMRYKMWKHDHEGSNPPNDRRFWLLKKAIDRINIDGLTSLIYRRLNKQALPTHTVVTVDFNEKELTKSVFGLG